MKHKHQMVSTESKLLMS